MCVYSVKAKVSLVLNFSILGICVIWTVHIQWTILQIVEASYSYFGTLGASPLSQNAFANFETLSVVAPRYLSTTLSPTIKVFFFNYDYSIYLNRSVIETWLSCNYPHFCSIVPKFQIMSGILILDANNWEKLWWGSDKYFLL